MRIQRALRVQAGDKVPFCQTMPFVERFLQENGLSYSRIECRLADTDANLLKRYPAIGGLPHITDSWGSSYFTNWGNKAVDVEPALIRQVLSRIPRSLHIDSANVRLMGVNWFGGDAGSPAESSIGMGRLAGDRPRWNTLDFLLDITDEAIPGGVQDDAGWIRRIGEYFGKIVSSGTRCLRTEQEKAELTEQANRFRKQYAYVWDTIELFLCPRDPEKYVPALDDILAAEPMSLKDILRAVFRGTGYRYVSGAGAQYTMRKINGNRHCMELHIDRGPSFKRMDSNMCIRGYNFEHPLFFPSYTALTVADMEKYIRCLRQMALYAEQELTAGLAEAYGPSPDWYCYG